MVGFELKQKITLYLSAGVLFLFSGCFLAFYQPEAKTDRIYKAALEDYEKGDYQNSYYLFSKVSLFSNLKPVALYHRAQCAKMLGDDSSELKHYELIFNNYPKHALSMRSRYMAAQKLYKQKPQIAKKYFEYILEHAPNTDYAIASEYYIGLISKNNFEGKKNIPTSARIDIENSFRHYLKKAPAGKHAYNAVNNWLEFSENITKDDYLLMANTAYLFGEYDKARQLLQKTDLSESWALDVKVSDAQKDYARAKSLTQTGLQSYSNLVSEDDVIEAIDIYQKLSTSKSQSIEQLLAFAKDKGKDYLLSQKCYNVDDKAACFNNLYITYPNGRFAADALSNLFFLKIRSGDLQSAKKIGKDHLNKFPNSNSAPMVMFWLGKIAEKENNFTEYNNYYKGVITKFPDSYYAYRAYLRLNHLAGPLITSYIKPKPVVYPYKYSRGNLAVKLVELGDYEAVNEIIGDDDFVKSWVLYEKGDYSHSMLVARDAMEKLENKPDKFDLRWRLVYPVLFYDDVKNYAAQTGNNLPLMLGLIREESYFDPLAQSVVGASGLMQIMPSTASEINSKYSLGMDVSSALFNPKMNIKIGNYYYEFLRRNLEGYDISSVAAYNGGIGSIQKWKTSYIYNDTDEFVEQIPYAETKNYVKKVFRSYWNYIRIYPGHN